ncbi:MAG: hypothetical protein FWD71_14705 [Oscillospiraceae bacterium]|nr:hypothetical protein [Oscillospiraceae bacterium]
MDIKTLIVYYSRSGKSEIIAKDLQNRTGCDTDKIEYANKNKISFIGAGFEAAFRKKVKIKGAGHNPGDYERIIFVTPVWAGKISTPIRSYMSENKANIKSYSLIATCGGSEIAGAIKDAADIMQKEPAVSERYLSKQIDENTYDLAKFM